MEWWRGRGRDERNEDEAILVVVLFLLTLVRSHILTLTCCEYYFIIECSKLCAWTTFSWLFNGWCIFISFCMKWQIETVYYVTYFPDCRILYSQSNMLDILDIISIWNQSGLLCIEKPVSIIKAVQNHITSAF